jgi:predicted AlkP superfamily pyrophosphatase or phosphodiesterase
MRALCLLLFLVSLASAAPNIPCIPPTERCVIVLSLDGFPAWLWRNPQLPVPTLRRLAREGASADAMTVSNPSVTWINHTTLVTGVRPAKHGVLFNGLLNRAETHQPPVVEPWMDKALMVRVPTLYDLAYRAGLRTAQVDWVAILNSGTIHHEFAEVPKLGRPIEQELIANGLLTPEDITTFNKKSTPAWRDHVWTHAACHILTTRKPHLLLFHLLNLDSTNHAYGPGTPASHTAYAYADRLVGDVLAAVDQVGLRDRTTLLITTDHGFKKVTKHVFPNVALRKAGLVTVADQRVERCSAYCMVQGGLAFAYVTDPTRKSELLPQLKAACEKIEGVAEVLDGNRGPELGMPTPDTNPGMGDLILYAKPGFAFQAAAVGEDEVMEARTYLGTHGYPASDPELDGILIAHGYGIAPGVRLERVENLDVAPTLARVLGLTLPDTDGRILTEFLLPSALPDVRSTPR